MSSTKPARASTKPAVNRQKSNLTDKEGKRSGDEIEVGTCRRGFDIAENNDTTPSGIPLSTFLVRHILALLSLSDHQKSQSKHLFQATD
jgi:hypothetical protein